MLDWVPATKRRVRGILIQEAYTGMYVYGVSRTIRALDPESDAPRERREATPINEQTRKPDHHPSYVRPEIAAEIRYRLSQNRNQLIGPLGRGEALVQGLLRCEIHQRALRASYSTRGRAKNGQQVRLAQYGCVPGQDDPDAEYCVQVRAKFVDPLVEGEVLRALKVPSLEVVQEATREAFREYDSLARARADELRKATAAATEIEREYDQTDALTYPEVKRKLKSRWEEALRAVEVLKDFHRSHPLEPPLTLDGGEQERLQSLFADLPSLWRHPKITAEQRKSVVRTIVKRITVRPAPDDLVLEIAWVGGETTVLLLPRWRRIRRDIEQAYGQCVDASTVADGLNQRGLVRMLGARNGEPYDAAAVEAVIARRGIQQRFDLGAYAYIRARVLEHASSRRIAEELTAKGIRHRRGVWTAKLVHAAIYRLRHKHIPRVDPLPSVQSVRPRIVELNDQGLRPNQIVAQANAENLRSRRRAPITLVTVYRILGDAGVPSSADVQAARLDEFLKMQTWPVAMKQLAERAAELGFRTRWGTPLTLSTLYRRATALGLRISRPRR